MRAEDEYPARPTLTPNETKRVCHPVPPCAAAPHRRGSNASAAALQLQSSAGRRSASIATRVPLRPAPPTALGPDARATSRPTSRFCARVLVRVLLRGGVTILH